MEIRDRWAVVTGAARRLGREIALGLARAGAHVVVHHGHSPAEAAETVREIEALGVDAVPIQADLASPEAIDRLFRDVEERCGRLDILVNSAASFVRRSLLEADVGEWDRVLAVNLRAPWLCLRRAAALMRKGGDGSAEVGSVVNIADLTGLQAWAGYTHHGVSKAGVLHLTRIAARELAPAIRVNSVVPGAILPPPGMSSDDPEWRRKAERLPLERVGEPSVISEAVVFLIRNHFVTGTTLVVDGGEHLLGGTAVE